MKAIYISVILFLGIMGCTKDVAVDQFSLREEFNLKTGGIYNASGFDLSIKIKEINDSRCPIGVTCFWAGEVAVKFEVNDGTAWDLLLRKPSAAIDTVNGYIFTLIDVKPYPKYQEEIPDSEKNVILQVDKL